MTAYAPLREELARWRDAGLGLPLWWRDDDAVEPTPALERLIALAAGLGAPLHLAVIPRHATAELAQRLRQNAGVLALVHGWAHANHAPESAKKAEFGAHRPLPDLVREAEAGLMRIEALFGPCALPVFVPPWNRIAPDLPAALPAQGFRALSRFGPRAAPGLAEVNTHVDPIDWHGGRSAVATGRLVAQIASDLALRRTGRTDAAEPYGLLTHHLAHDEAVWSVIEDLAGLLGDSGVARWVEPFAAL
ncbi:MAG: polysaccharide deacetylase family protein [Rhizobiaceae bacterium]